MSIQKDNSWFAEAMEESRIRTLKNNLVKFETVDAFVEQNIKTYLTSLSCDLKQNYKSMLVDLNNLDVADDTKFKDYEYFKDYCLQLKKDFKSNYRFTVVQEPTDDNFGQIIINIEIITSTKNYNIELMNYSSDRGLWFGINNKDYYLSHTEVGTILSLNKLFNLTKIIKQIINQNKENKIYKLDLRSNIMVPFFKTSKTSFLILPLYDTSGNSFAPLGSKLLTAL
ncbi:hypothetical protein [Sulfurimonas sp.]|uniref:hypothetical protein n=1 Tax=Sulfurimonas sp. TaxID=2022749 RepID=UPI002AB03DC0|nr:hypothetical protein [Sulfurimonas sp.]